MADINLIIKSSPNLRAYYLARVIIRRVREVLEVNHLEQIHQVQLVPLYRHQQRMNLWRDIRVRKAIVIEYVAHLVVPRHLAFEVSKYL